MFDLVKVCQQTKQHWSFTHSFIYLHGELNVHLNCYGMSGSCAPENKVSLNKNTVMIGLPDLLHCKNNDAYLSSVLNIQILYICISDIVCYKNITMGSTSGI